MITAFGHPKRIKTPQEATATSPITFLSVSPCEKYFAALSAFSLCVYSNLQHRVLLAHIAREYQNLDFGSHHALLWSHDSKQLYVTTKPGRFVCIYTLSDENAANDDEFGNELDSDQDEKFLDSFFLLQEGFRARSCKLELLTVLNLPVRAECISKALDYLVLGCSRQLSFFLICFADVKNLNSVVYLSEFQTEETWREKQNKGKKQMGGFETFDGSCGASDDAIGCRSGCSNKRGAYLYAFLTSASSVLQHLEVRKEKYFSAELVPENEENDDAGNQFVNRLGEVQGSESLARGEARNKHTKHKDKCDHSFNYNPLSFSSSTFVPTASSSSSVHSSFSHSCAYESSHVKNDSFSSFSYFSTPVIPCRNGIQQIALNESLDKMALVLACGVAVVLAWQLPFDKPSRFISSSMSTSFSCFASSACTLSASSSSQLSSFCAHSSSTCLSFHCRNSVCHLGKMGGSDCYTREITGEKVGAIERTVDPLGFSLPPPIGIIVRCCGTEAVEFNAARSIIALALKDGSVDIISLSPLCTQSCATPLTRVNVIDTLGVSCTPSHFRGVQKMEWSSDGFAIAVGWKNGGLAVFSYNGQPLFSPFRSPESLSSIYNSGGGYAYDSHRSSFSSSFSRKESCEPGKPLGGILSLCWASYDFALIACYRSTCDELTEFVMYKSAALGVAPSALDYAGSKFSGDSNTRHLHIYVYIL